MVEIFYLDSIAVDIIEDSNKQKSIKYIFLEILEKEQIGIPISPELLDKSQISIVNEDQILFIFI